MSSSSAAAALPVTTSPSPGPTVVATIGAASTAPDVDTTSPSPGPTVVATIGAASTAPDVDTFATLGIPPALVAVLARQGISSPLPIQRATIVDTLAGRDVCGRAPTGSGKTLAFALPVAATVAKGAPRRPKALVVVPTRELAAQIAETLTPLLAARQRRVHPFYGGVGFGPQRAALRRGVDVAVACPGRLLDLVGTADIDLADVATVVLDEADRMADMGFLPAVRRILDATRPDRQTLLFSATLDGDVDVLVRRYQHDPARHEVEPAVDACGGATHRFVPVARDDKLAVCAELASARPPTIVFVRTKHGADRLALQLDRRGTPAVAIHGGRSQGQRERALAAFRSGRVGVLVATDVAARGIHVDDVGCVVHYDLPADPKDYVHRSGRTARAGAGGTVVALVTPDQAAAAAALRRAVDVTQDLTQDLTQDVPEASSSPTAGARPGGDRRRAPATRPPVPGRRRPGRPAGRPFADDDTGTGRAPGSGRGMRTGRSGAPDRGPAAGRPSRVGTSPGSGHAARSDATDGARRPSAPGRPAGTGRPSGTARRADGTRSGHREGPAHGSAGRSAPRAAPTSGRGRDQGPTGAPRSPRRRSRPSAPGR
jgi:superfamily II DNA/RNA helicase